MHQNHFTAGIVQVPRLSADHDGYLGKVGDELRMFTIGVWNRSNVPDPKPGSPDNPLPSMDDLAKLSQVYKLYATHFTGKVVLSQDAKQQKQALLAAHETIRQQGLDQLLPDHMRVMMHD